MRGNHYHPNSTEWLLVFGGAALFCWQDPEDGIIYKEKIGEEEPALFEIPPNIAHVIKNSGQRDIYIMAVTSSPHPDQVRYSQGAQAGEEHTGPGLLRQDGVEMRGLRQGGASLTWLGD